MHRPHYALRVVSPPAVEPIDLAAAKVYLRVDSDAEDAMIAGLIAAARDYIEGQTGRTLLPTQYRMSLDRFPLVPGLQYCAGLPPAASPMINGNWPLDPANWAIGFPRSPLLSVQSIAYVDPDSVARTMDPADYAVDTDSEPPRVTPVAVTSWPGCRFGPGAVTVAFTAGYAIPAAVPPQIGMALQMLIGHWYVNRQAVDGGGSAEVPIGVRAILSNVATFSF